MESKTAALDLAFPAQHAAHGAAQQTFDPSCREQPSGSLLQRGKMRDLLQAQNRTQFGQVGQILANAAIVGLKEDLQHQAGEQLGLRVDLWTVEVRVLTKCCRSDGQSLTGNPRRGFARNAHAPLYAPGS